MIKILANNPGKYVLIFVENSNISPLLNTSAHQIFINVCNVPSSRIGNGLHKGQCILEPCSYALHFIEEAAKET